MFSVKNRSREVKTYQYPSTVSAGPVRPQPQTVFRSEHNPKNGEVVRREKSIVLGGVLTIPPRGELRNLPDALLSHPALQRDMASRAVAVTQHASSPNAVSVAPPEPVRPPATVPPAASESKKFDSRRRK